MSNDCSHHKSFVNIPNSDNYICIHCGSIFSLMGLDKTKLIYCSHYKSLVKSPNSDDYMCIKCGEKFSLMALDDDEFRKIVLQVKELRKGVIQEALEEAIDEWIQVRNQQKKNRSDEKFVPNDVNDEDLR